MSRRRFTGQQRSALYIAADGHCSECGTKLGADWHADHKEPWSKGGATDVINGQALCPACNLKKGAKSLDTGKPETNELRLVREWMGNHAPRVWQAREANNFWNSLVKWQPTLLEPQFIWLGNLFPGAGKTEWSLVLARWMLDVGYAERVEVVVPSKIIQDQWTTKDKNKILALDVRPNAKGGTENPRDRAFQGCVVTYQQVAADPNPHRMACDARKTVVILDEIHHAGYPKKTWGDRLELAFKPVAPYIIGLTGTPWRASLHEQIAFVSSFYDSAGRLVAHSNYGYGQAVNDGVCRRIEFYALNGEVHLVNVDSCVPQGDLTTISADDDGKAAGLVHFFQPGGQWIQDVIRMADKIGDETRQGSEEENAVPDEKRLVLCDNQKWAALTVELIKKMTGDQVVLIVSDESDAKKNLEAFRTDPNLHWAVAVDMFSEGVDVPAVYTIVLAMTTRSLLKFHQIIGRGIRRRDGENQPCRVLMLATETMTGFAASMNKEVYDAFQAEEEESTGTGSGSKKSSSPFIFGSTSGLILDKVITGEDGVATEGSLVTHAATLGEKVGFPSTAGVKLARFLEMDRKGYRPTAPQASQVHQAKPSESDMDMRKLKKKLEDRVDALTGMLARKRAESWGQPTPESIREEKITLNTDLKKQFGPKVDRTIEELQKVITHLRERLEG